MKENDSIPVVSDWLQAGFHLYIRRLIRRHFHSLAYAGDLRYCQAIDPSQPLIVYVNHPSWWDPLVAHLINRSLFPKRQFFAPIDAEALQQYRVFEKLGFFGVQLNSGKGAAAFLMQSRAILSANNTALWLTPEGQFADVRNQSLPLMPGLSHLCYGLQRGCALPICIEYVFWEERLPECLFKIGEPLYLDQHTDADKQQWQQMLTDRLRQTQRELATHVILRDAAAFENLLTGNRGAGVLYDSMRRTRAWLTGSSFRTSHGEKLH